MRGLRAPCPEDIPASGRPDASPGDQRRPRPRPDRIVAPPGPARESGGRCPSPSRCNGLPRRRDGCRAAGRTAEPRRMAVTGPSFSSCWTVLRLRRHRPARRLTSSSSEVETGSASWVVAWRVQRKRAVNRASSSRAPAAPVAGLRFGRSQHLLQCRPANDFPDVGEEAALVGFAGFWIAAEGNLALLCIHDLGVATDRLRGLARCTRRRGRHRERLLLAAGPSSRGPGRAARADTWPQSPIGAFSRRGRQTR